MGPALIGDIDFAGSLGGHYRFVAFHLDVAHLDELLDIRRIRRA